MIHFPKGLIDLPDGRLAPHAGRIIPYHLILEGACTVQVGAEPPLVVSAPAVVCFSHGDVHRLAGDAVGTTHVPLPVRISSEPSLTGPRLFTTLWL